MPMPIPATCKGSSGSLVDHHRIQVAGRPASHLDLLAKVVRSRRRRRALRTPREIKPRVSLMMAFKFRV
jgi:tRNA A37 threonylcarbamoyladenosine dehydratase